MIPGQTKLIVGISSILFVSLLLSCASNPGEMDLRAESTLKSLMNIEPVPELAPEDVVRIQLTALKTNDRRDNGIELAYRFISDRNRKLAGDVDRFAEIIRNDSYRPMLDHTEHRLFSVSRKNETALVAVEISLPGGDTSSYIFVLQQQKGGEFDDCWLTEGVLQVAPRRAIPFEIPQTQAA